MKVFATMLTALAAIATLPAIGARAAEPPAQPAATNLLTNPGFEASGDSTPGWEAFWTRKPNAGTAALDAQVHHGGAHALEVRHTGDADWSEAQTAKIPVAPGDILSLSAWIKSEGLTPEASREAGEVGISVVARRSDGTTIDWQLGFAPAGGHHDWKPYTHSFVVPAECATVQFRFTGTGPIHAWLDDASLIRAGNVKSLAARSAGKSLRLTNRFLDARIVGDTGALTVTDKRIGQTWTQQVDTPDIVVTGMEPISPQ